MFQYKIFDIKHNLLLKVCESLEEAIFESKQLMLSKKIRIKKTQNDKVIREFSFIVKEGKDTLISYIDAGGLVIASPI